MASAISWGALSASTLAASAEFDSLADEANFAGSLVQASAFGNMFSDWFMRTGAGTAPSGHIDLYFVTQMGGSAADGDGSTDPAPTALKATFPLREATGAQLVSREFILTPNRDFTPICINRAGVTLSGSENFLYFQTYDTNPDA